MRDETSRLLRRWFVEYNPLALLSAALILGGIWILSREAAQHASLLGHLGVAALAEIYAFALIGGAWFLMRLRMPRAAGMLGILAALYQADLTMHLETSSYLGWAGRGASVAWLGLFGMKLVLLTAALRLRLSRSALAIPLVGAAGLAALPHLLRTPLDGEVLAGLFVFLLFGAALLTRREIRGATDVRAKRALVGVWLTWGALTLGHVLYGLRDHRLGIGLVLAALALVGTRIAQRERTVWLVSVGVLAEMALFDREHLWAAALMVAATLVARALRSPTPVAAAPPREEPYRDAIPPRPPHLVHALAGPSAQARLLGGALASLYLAALQLTADLPGGPATLIALAALALSLGALAWRTRRLWAPWPLALVGAHAILAEGLTPRTPLAWGAVAITAGFLTLAASLALSWRHAEGDGVNL